MWPAYIMGSMRSGSTLLRYILDAHDEIACPPETKFVGGIDAFLDYPQTLPGLWSIGVTPPALYNRLGAFVNSILADYARRRNKRRWIDKTPSYYRLVPVIERMFNEQVLYVVIVRHPLDCIASLETFTELSTTHEDPDIVRIAAQHGKGRYAWALYWREVYNRLRYHIEEKPDRFSVVRYEDLVREPDAAVRRVLRFLGESYQPGIVDKAFSVPHDEGYQDLKITRTTAVHRKSVGCSNAWTTSGRTAAWNIVRDTANFYAYDETA